MLNLVLNLTVVVDFDTVVQSNFVDILLVVLVDVVVVDDLILKLIQFLQKVLITEVIQYDNYYLHFLQIKLLNEIQHVNMIMELMRNIHILHYEKHEELIDLSKNLELQM